VNTKIVRFWILMAIVHGAVAGTTAQERRITAREVVAEIQKQVGVEFMAIRLPPKKMYSAVVVPEEFVSARISPPEPYQYSLLPTLAARRPSPS